MAVDAHVHCTTVDQATGPSLQEHERRVRGVAVMRGVELDQLLTRALAEFGARR